MFASICRRRLLRLLEIPCAAGTSPSQPNPIGALLSHGYSSAALAGAPVSKPCPTTVSYLTSCGLSPAAAAAGKVRALFLSYGFTDADITSIVRRASVILILDPDRFLRPKLDLFASLGVRPRKLAASPNLLKRSLDKHLVPCVQFLRGIIGTDGDVCRAISRNPRGFTVDLDKNMCPAVDTLRRLGLPEESIAKLLTINLVVLMNSPGRISQIFEDLKTLGLGVIDKGFLYGICALCYLGRENWLRRLALYQSFGVSEGELLKAFKRQPTILLFSDETIKKKLRFLLDELKLELHEVMKQPVVIGYSLEKSIIPRCAVLSLLTREGKIEPSINLLRALLGSAKSFSEKYVLRYAHDVPDVVRAYEGKITFEGFRD